MKLISTLATLAGIVTLSNVAIAQEPVTLDILYAQPSFAKFHEPIAAAYSKLHPEVTIHYRAPAKDYDEGHLLMQRLAITNQLPDIYYPGYHLAGELVSVLEPRGQILDLQPFLDAESPEWIKENYDPAMMKLGVIGGKKYGMAFNASMPIMYINETALEAAGIDPKVIPSNWDELLANAAKVTAFNKDVSGVGYTIYDFPDSWLWQAILYQQGTAMVDQATGGIGFNNEKGLEALRVLRRLVTEGGMQLLEFEQARQQFAAGQSAYFFETPARLAQVIELVGDRFKLNTGKFPINDKEKGGLPTGGSAAIITSADAAKQKAAWDFIKFATGPEGQKIVVETTGYLPTNLLAQGPEYLGEFYKKDPRFTTVASQMPLARLWDGYKGGSSVRIWRAQREVINSIVRGEVTPEEGMAKLVEVTNASIK